MQLPLKTSLRGSCFVPPDKSISHRAVLFASLAEGRSKIQNFLPSDDCLSTVSCMRQLGVSITEQGGEVIVQGAGLRGLTAPHALLNTGNSGTTTRLLCGLLSGQTFHSVLSGDESLCRRPMNRVIIPLSRMGANIVSRDGLCPLSLSPASLTGISYEMPQASAQVKSALLLAGLYAEGETRITEHTLSRDHSERMLIAMGCSIVSEAGSICLTPPEKLSPIDVTVPGDLSSAAFLLVAASLLPGSCLTIQNVGINPTRTGVLEVLMQMGADIAVENQRNIGGEPIADLTVRSAPLHSVSFGGNIIPKLIDEIPILAVAAAFATGKTVISGAGELRVKESDRIETVCSELQKAGVDISPTPDGMIIQGGHPLRSAIFESWGDHRIAMACAVLALGSQQACELLHHDCVSVSFPGFFELLNRL